MHQELTFFYRSTEWCLPRHLENHHLFGIKTAPAWPPLPSKSTLILAGAAMAVTMPIDIPTSKYRPINGNFESCGCEKNKMRTERGLPSSSKMGPCSICNSTKAEQLPFFKNTLGKSSSSFAYPAALAASKKDMF